MTFEKSTTKPLRFIDEEDKFEEEEEVQISNISVDQEDLKVKEEHKQLKDEIYGLKDELDEFDKFIQMNFNDDSNIMMLKDMDSDTENKLDNTDDLINFDPRDFGIDSPLKPKKKKGKKDDSFEL